MYICSKHNFNYLSLAHNHHSLESYAIDAKPGVTQTPLQTIIIMENSYTYIGIRYSLTLVGTVLVPLKISNHRILSACNSTKDNDTYGSSVTVLVAWYSHLLDLTHA